MEAICSRSDSNRLYPGNETTDGQSPFLVSRLGAQSRIVATGQNVPAMISCFWASLIVDTISVRCVRDVRAQGAWYGSMYPLSTETDASLAKKIKEPHEDTIQFIGIDETDIGPQ